MARWTARARRVGIVSGQGTVIHSTPGQGVHESPLSELTAYSPIDGVIPR